MNNHNAFAGISGAVTSHKVANPQVVSVVVEERSLLLEPTGRWAVRLTTLEPEVARMLMQMLRDLGPAATQEESSLIRQVVAFDDAAQTDSNLIGEIERGLAALDTLARKLTKRRYVEVTERSLRRALISQISDLPLMHRLGVRTPAYASAAI